MNSSNNNINSNSNSNPSPDLLRRAKHIRMLATDLDRSLLNREHRVTPENRSALERCARQGICLVLATGRALSTVPDEARGVKGVRYLTCANGAKIYDNQTNELLYERYLSAEAVEYVAPFVADNQVLCEFFWGGYPYVEAELYETHAGIPDWFLGYFLESRKPVKNLLAVVREHIHEIENVNFVFDTEDVKTRVRDYLKRGERLYELTSSLAFNFEIGGAGVNKASALKFIARREEIAREEIIGFGDSANDIKMIEYAGVGVAMENATPEVRAAADFVTTDCEHSGVAHALETLGLLEMGE